MPSGVAWRGNTGAVCPVVRSRAAPASAMMNADDMRQITMFAHVINKLAIAKKEQAGVDLTSEEVSVLVTGIKLLIPKKKS
jgi:hypothetical protein